MQRKERGRTRKRLIGPGVVGGAKALYCCEKESVTRTKEKKVDAGRKKVVPSCLPWGETPPGMGEK